MVDYTVAIEWLLRGRLGWEEFLQVSHLTLFLAGYLIPTDRGGGGEAFRPALLKL